MTPVTKQTQEVNVFWKVQILQLTLHRFPSEEMMNKTLEHTCTFPEELPIQGEELSLPWCECHKGLH